MSTIDELEKTPGKRLQDIQMAFVMDKMSGISKDVTELKTATEQWRKSIDDRCERHVKNTVDNRLLLENKANRNEMDLLRQSSFRNTVYISLLTTLPHLIAIVGGIIAIIAYMKTGKAP